MSIALAAKALFDLVLGCISFDVKDPVAQADPIVDRSIGFFCMLHEDNDGFCRSFGVVWLAHERAYMLDPDRIGSFNLFLDFVDMLTPES